MRENAAERQAAPLGDDQGQHENLWQERKPAKGDAGGTRHRSSHSHQPVEAGPERAAEAALHDDDRADYGPVALRQRERPGCGERPSMTATLIRVACRNTSG